MKKILFIDDLFLTGIVIQRLQQTNYLNYSNYLNDANDLKDLNDYLKADTNVDTNTIRILDWSKFYNYRFQKFIKALTQKDNSFNSIFFINDLDKMPNRAKLVEMAWNKMIKKLLSNTLSLCFIVFFFSFCERNASKSKGRK